MANGNGNPVLGYLGALGPILVALVAVYGDRIRARLFGPRLAFDLEDASGHLAHRADGSKTIYYHIKVNNGKRRDPARNVRVVCIGIAKKAADLSFVAERVVYPVPLTWTPADCTSAWQTVAGSSTCDLGYLEEAGGQFKLAHCFWPDGFPGYICANGAMRVTLAAEGDNVYSSAECEIEIAWDGVWEESANERTKHLVVKRIG